jgi:hypothetical protein
MKRVGPGESHGIVIGLTCAFDALVDFSILTVHFAKKYATRVCVMAWCSVINDAVRSVWCLRVRRICVQQRALRGRPSAPLHGWMRHHHLQLVIHGAHQRADLLDQVTLSTPNRAESQLRSRLLACRLHSEARRVRPYRMPAHPQRTVRPRARHACGVGRCGCLEECSHSRTISPLNRSGIVRLCLVSLSWFTGSCRPHCDVLDAVDIRDGGNCPVASTCP